MGYAGASMGTHRMTQPNTWSQGIYNINSETMLNMNSKTKRQFKTNLDWGQKTVFKNAKMVVVGGGLFRTKHMERLFIQRLWGGRISDRQSLDEEEEGYTWEKSSRSKDPEAVSLMLSGLDWRQQQNHLLENNKLLVV